MFYEGTLQEGISTAVGQQKLVFCFVANENDESQTWENEYLRDESLKDVIAKRAVALRLTAGTEEAGYLAQIFPLPQTPTIVIMKHGELKEYIAAGTSKDEFFRRVQNSFDMPPSPSPSRSPASTAQPPASDALSPSPPTISAASSGTSSLAGVPPTIEQSDNVRRVLEQRAAKQEAAKQAAEKKAAEDDSARQKLQTEKEAEARKSTQKQTELLKKKKQQEAEERRRILKRIQDDKDERRKQAQERELQRVGSQPRAESPSSVANSTSPSTRPSSTRTGEYTSIQVRLFDGSTIRSRFKTASAVKHVRKWVDEARTDGSMPYSFRQLLTPLPNRPIDDTEEDESMGEVGLSPSSTLILVPVRNYASAYSDSSQGVFSRVMGLILGVFTWLFGLLGLGGVSNNQPAPEQSANSMSAPAKKRRVQGFENPNDGRRDHQLYNGNSLNFEPRPDEDEKK